MQIDQLIQQGWESGGILSDLKQAVYGRVEAASEHLQETKRAAQDAIRSFLKESGNDFLRCKEMNDPSYQKECGQLVDDVADRLANLKKEAGDKVDEIKQRLNLKERIRTLFDEPATGTGKTSRTRD